MLLIVINSFKSQKAIFGEPLGAARSRHLDFRGYDTVWHAANFPLYFANSLIVTLGSLVLMLLFGAMAAWALTEYRFKLSRWLALYIALGIMVPIRLGTVAILKL